MSVFLLTLTVFAVATTAMASGVILSRGKKQLKGSCGGPSVNPSCCMTCPDKKDCDTEIVKELEQQGLTQIQTTTHSESGQPIGSPSQLN